MKMSKIRKRTPKQGGGNGHKTNWLQLLKNSLVAIVADTGELQADWVEDGRLDAILDLCALEATLTDIKGVGWSDQNLTTIDGIVDDIKALLVEGGTIDQLIDDIKALLVDDGVIDQLLDDILADTVTISGGALPASPTENSLARFIASGGTALGEPLPENRSLIDLLGAFTGPVGGAEIDDNIFAALAIIKTAIDGIAGVNTYQEQIPDTHILLEAIDKTLSDDPPGADEENSVVDIDAVGDATFVLRSLIINVVGFGTDATKLTFGLWVPVNGTILEVDTVEVTDTGYQNLMDLFGLPEVHADSIHITVISDGDTADASIAGTYKYAKANS